MTPGAYTKHGTGANSDPEDLQHQDSLVFARGGAPFFLDHRNSAFQNVFFLNNVIPERFPTKASFFSSSSSLVSHLDQVFHEVLWVTEPAIHDG
jgi:hypothetical protein